MVVIVSQLMLQGSIGGLEFHHHCFQTLNSVKRVLEKSGEIV
jgi:hypothetical protein